MQWPARERRFLRTSAVGNEPSALAAWSRADPDLNKGKIGFASYSIAVELRGKTRAWLSFILFAASFSCSSYILRGNAPTCGRVAHRSDREGKWRSESRSARTSRSNSGSYGCESMALSLLADASALAAEFG